MHHVVREPCHTGYLNTVQHTDLDFFRLPTTNISIWNRFNWCTVWSRGTTSNWHSINFDSLLSPMKTPTMCGIWFPHRRAMHAVVATPGQSEVEETTPTTWNRWPCWAVTTRQASVWRIWGLVCESSCVVLVVLNHLLILDLCVYVWMQWLPRPQQRSVSRCWQHWRQPIISHRRERWTLGWMILWTWFRHWSTSPIDPVLLGRRKTGTSGMTPRITRHDGTRKIERRKKRRNCGTLKKNEKDWREAAAFKRDMVAKCGAYTLFKKN